MKRLIILSLFILLVLSISVRAEITTGKTSYMPSETVNIVLYYSKPLTGVKFNIINPNGNVEISGTPMKNISSNIWGYNYTLNTRALNGTYTIKINALQGGTVVNASMPVLTFKGSFDVLAWNVNTYLNKGHFTPGETINLTVLITDKYSDSLTFKVFYSIKDSRGNKIEAKNLTLTEVNNGFTDVYEIPADYPFGASTINITLIDSDGRTSNTNLGFSVSKSLAITPDTINETVTNTIEKTFEFENFMDYDINIRNIEVSDSLKGVILIVQRPYLITSNSKAMMKIRILAANMTEGSYSGVIDISTDKETIPVYVYLKIIPSAGPVGNTQENYLGNIDYSYIIWYFAAGIVAVIITLTALRYRKIIKKKKEEKKKQEEKKKKENNYYKSQEEYRTEYY
jgi:hypothetical protein